MRRENEYGLTYAEWHAAATFGVRGEIATPEKRLREAWKAGECPCDWALHHHEQALALRN